MHLDSDCTFVGGMGEGSQEFPVNPLAVWEWVCVRGYEDGGGLFRSGDKIPLPASHTSEVNSQKGSYKRAINLRTAAPVTVHCPHAPTVYTSAAHMNSIQNVYTYIHTYIYPTEFINI